MQCIMPYIEVPDQFVPLLDTIAADPDFAFYRRRRKRMLTVGDVAKGKNRRSIFAWLRTLRSKLSTKRPVKRRRDLSLVNQSGMSMTVYVLLRFDWLTINASRLLPNVTLLLHNPPTVEVPDSVIPFYPNRGQIIEIRVGVLRVFSRNRSCFSVFLPFSGFCTPLSIFSFYLSVVLRRIECRLNMKDALNAGSVNYQCCVVESACHILRREDI
jgi:hypothetical protein